jgi:hypothetical protein
MAKWWNKKTKIIFFVAVGVLLVTVASFVTYYSFPMRAEQKELQAAQNMPTVRYTDTPDAIVLAPLATVKKGIVLYAGGRVEPSAYAYKMAGIAQSGVAVVIAKSPLHLPPLDWRSPSQFTGLVPSVTEWYVAGHSVGGVRACQVVGDGTQFKGLILLGAYCANNISGAGVTVLSLGGENDKLTTPDDIGKNKHLLPVTTKYESIVGLNHAGFGDYGKQNGDGDITISDTEARDAITHHITTLLGTAKAGSGQSGAQQ